MNSRSRSLYDVARPPVCRLSVWLSVARAPYTQAVVIFGSISTAFGTLVIFGRAAITLDIGPHSSSFFFQEQQGKNIMSASATQGGRNSLCHIDLSRSATEQSDRELPKSAQTYQLTLLTR